MNTKITKGYKVTDKDFKCRGYQYELNKVFTHNGNISVCNSGFHFCEKANDCFNYYDFDSSNRVFEIEAYNDIKTESDKSVCSTIKFIRELTWHEVLDVVNIGKNNTGHSNSGNWNSGNRNSGNWNSGNRNSGNRNSGDSNSGYSNSGNRNSGDSNSGYSNSGNWNSGDSNSGDSNSGYRNSGAFSTDNNPFLVLFDKPTTIRVRDWGKMEVRQLMFNLRTTIWVPVSIMTDKEKADNPNYETTEGYLKTISLKEAWANFWGNLADEKKKLFTSLPNFDAAKFEEITGIKLNI